MTSDLTRELRQVGGDHRKAVRVEEKARRARDRALKKALKAGVSVTDAARAAGVSRHTAARAR